MADETALKERLEEAIRRREALALKHQRVMGRIEENDLAMEALRADCRAKNLDPEQLDATIARLESALEQFLGELEAQLTQAERALEPYTKK